MVTIILQSPVSIAQDAEPWGDMIVLNEQVRYTQEDADRYLRLHHETWEMSRWTLIKSATLESEAEFDQELIKNGELKVKMYNALPDASDISQDEAICIAYAWVEQKYGLSEDVFMKFFTYVRFWANTDDDTLKLWCVYFDLLDSDDYALYGGYHIYINSQTGAVVRSNDPSTAVG